MDLFREEAIAELKQYRYGEIRLVRPPSLMAYTLFFSIVISVIIYFFFTFEASRKAVLTGMLVAEHGATRIYAGAPALLLSSKFHDGQHVKKGDVLFVLSPAAAASVPAKQAATGNTVILAPCDGMLSVLAERGQTVPAASVLAIISPADDVLLADLFADSATAGRIRLGDKVSIRYNAYPFQKFGHYYGTVVAISEHPVAGRDIPYLDKKTISADALYTLRVKLDEQAIKAYGKTIRHKPGMRLEASIPLERHKLYEWIIPSI